MDEALPTPAVGWSNTPGQHTKRWGLRRSQVYDGFLFWEPEYNQSTSGGPEERGIDYLSAEWNNKAGWPLRLRTVFARRGFPASIEHPAGYLQSNFRIAHFRSKQIVRFSMFTDFDNFSFEFQARRAFHPNRPLLAPGLDQGLRPWAGAN